MPTDYCVDGSKEKYSPTGLKGLRPNGSNTVLNDTTLNALHVPPQLSSELALTNLCPKMDSGETAIGQEATSRPRETAKVTSRWRQKHSSVNPMSTFEEQKGQRQSQADPEQIGTTTPAQAFPSGQLGPPMETAQQASEKQYAHHRPSSYSYRHSLSFPQHVLHQRFVHSTKPHQSLEGHAWPFPGHLPTGATEDMFSFQVHGHVGSYSRKKLSSINAAYGQYSQKSVEQLEDAHKKEQKPKKPGKYICPYCTRACAKPSVLKKHIRSHTGERPYPCIPCGFSFKTKSNLYKHRKSHAHAIKAGLVPFTDASVSRLDLEAACIDVEADIPSDGDQSTDTDEEGILFVEGSGQMSPVAHIPLDMISKLGESFDPSLHGSTEELGGPMKVPILIIPKSGIHLPLESSPYITSDVLQNPLLISKADDSHTVKQKLALRLSEKEKKGHDSEQSLNLLSPHSKGSTDSGYFSRSESAEQQVSPPNTNAMSYEEIIFGKYCRLSPRAALAVAAGSQDGDVICKEGGVEPHALLNPALDINTMEEHLSQLTARREGALDLGRFNTIKSSTLSSSHSTESCRSDTMMESCKGETSFFPESHPGSTTALLEAPSETSPLIRSNSMPTSSATNLSIPLSLRGSHSFDERMTGSDDVFYPGAGGTPSQRMLRRQAAFELPSVQEGHSDSEHYGRIARGSGVAPGRSSNAERGPNQMEKKLAMGERAHYDYDPLGRHLRRWEDYEAPKQSYREVQWLGGIRQGGEYGFDMTASSQGVTSRFGNMFETRKRRKEKSVGDEEDAPMLCCSGAGTSIVGIAPTDYELKSQIHEAVRSGFGVSGIESAGHGQLERFETCRPHPQSASPVPEDTLSGTDHEKTADTANKKVPGNVISVIQHTNSLSRPNSFERSESADLIAGQQDKPYSPSEAADNEIADSPMNPDWTQHLEHAEGVGKSPAPQQPQLPYHMPPRLVRQHNIQVPEIRVTEEPDKPEKIPEPPAKEPEKPPEEFQWPQRSETLSQLPAEKLPPKKKRLRLADIEHSSGESSFESAGTASLSRSPSQESNLSHSSSLSMSFDREESIKSTTPMKQDELAKQAEFLSVPPGSYSLSVPGHPHQKEMRRSSSEQMPCPNLTEIPELRSKSFDYGNLTHASSPGVTVATLSPCRERKKCFLVRQASFSGFPEGPQTDQGVEQGIKQEHVDQTHSSRRSAQLAWHHSSSSSTSSTSSGLHNPSQSDEPGKPFDGSSAHPYSSTSHHAQHSKYSTSQEVLRHPLISHAPYISSRHAVEQQHTLSHQDKVTFPTLHSTLFPMPQPTVCVAHLPVPHPVLWQSCAEPLQRHFHHQLQQLQKAYGKHPMVHPLQTEHHASYPLEHAKEQVGKKTGSYMSSPEKPYQGFSEAALSHPRNVLSKLQTDHSGASSEGSTDQLLQTALVSQHGGTLQSLPGAVVPVRIQTHVPSYASIMYTSISQILVTHAQTNSPSIVICKVTANTSQRTLATTAAMRGIGLNIAQMLGQHSGLEQYPLWKVPHTLPLGLEAGIPLCLASNTDTASSLGGAKRMLSPASSLELFVETKQQKRVKEEKMYGQIVEELSAVELTNSDIKKDLPRSAKPQLVRQCCTTESKDSQPSVLSSSPLPLRVLALPSLPTCDSDPSTSDKHCESGSKAQEADLSDVPEGRMSPDGIDDEETASDMSLSPQRSSSSPCELDQDDSPEPQNPPGGMSPYKVSSSSPCGTSMGSAILLTDALDIHQALQFPSLRTTTTVSWCFLNYAKPNHVHQETLKSSVYASWCIRSSNLNPAGLNTRTTLALLRSKQRNTLEIYSMTAMHRPGAGKLTSSSAWKQQYGQLKPESSHLSKLEKKSFGNLKERSRGDSHGDKDLSTKQTEPIRIKIFEGGFKSNEDYIYVRGRGRGKYICEECGIRCKKPSMLKKHIRTHTDVRPYVCKLCNFAFKTKGNLTKHMKSKAHMKKCLELGVAMTSIDDTDAEESENIEDMQKDSEKGSVRGISMDHQFSDAEDSDGDDGDDNEDDDDDDDDFDEHQGDSTPSTRSRSTSPQPPRFPSLSVTAALSQRASSESPVGHSSLMSYLSTLPSIQVTPLLTPGDSHVDSQIMEYQRYLHAKCADLEHEKDRLDIPSSMDEEYMHFSETSSSPRDFSCSSLQSSPGCDSSPCRDNSPKRYLMPSGDMSPRRHLSPRRDVSPMRHLSPRKEAALRRELSPRRDVSPRRHLSPLRPMSPGKDLSCRRDLSPRTERRYIASGRTASPRRGLYYNPSMPQVHYFQPDLGALGNVNLPKGLPKASYGSLYGDKEAPPQHQEGNQFLEGHNDYVFSHLPLHSQLQVRAPLPMIPVGGIQMVHSGHETLSGLHPPPTKSLPMKCCEEKRSAIPHTCTKEQHAVSKHHEKHALPHSLSHDISLGSSPSLLPSLRHTVSEDSLKPVVREQEEHIHTCTKAIASLRIAPEEAGLLGANLLARAHEPHPKTLESALLDIRHLSGSEPGQPPANALAIHPDSNSTREGFGTTRTLIAPSSFHSKSPDVKQLGFHGKKDTRTGTHEGEEALVERGKPH
ncbi:transcription factor HIVEP2 [Ambystoma mexicanum]|uniref:transcription factor HIVEP2 n=1 Tax=Ambystoma mexicanum TaxID=8296 RepID=UPI0037E7DB3E